jgi:Replication-relaxation
LLRTLAHTLGANAVFVAFAKAAEIVRRAGGTDRLVDWRSAAACERRHCKPDGYGCYVRDGRRHGFFLEYDRGTESGHKYRAKLRAYYRYRESGAAARDYEGFPTLLFVTTDPIAELRIANAAQRTLFCQYTEPLAVLITTAERISHHREGILGPIWRTPTESSSRAGDELQYWLPGRGPRGLFGIGRERLRTPRLEWPTARQAGPRLAGVVEDACEGH